VVAAASRCLWSFEANGELKVKSFRHALKQLEADPTSTSFDSRDCRMTHAGPLGHLALREPEVLSPAPQKLPELVDHKRSTDFLGRFWAV
jgi:hypothetical protein